MSGEWDEQQKIGRCVEDQSMQQHPEKDRGQPYIIFYLRISQINFFSIPEYIVPVFFDKVHFVEGNVEFVTDISSVLSVMVRCAMTSLICQVPIGHERSNHIESCTRKYKQKYMHFFTVSLHKRANIQLFYDTTYMEITTFL